MLHSDKIDRETYYHAVGKSNYNTGGWTANFKTKKARKKFINKQFPLFVSVSGIRGVVNKLEPNLILNN